jgi:hypothetical protein
MGWTCPECGAKNTGDLYVCACGFDQSSYLASDPVEAELAEDLDVDDYLLDAAFSAGNISSSASPASSVTKKAVAEKQGARRSSLNPSDRIIVKEVGPWEFSFSPSEGRISIGTEALKPFRLDVTVRDIEDILEAVYGLTGKRKTLRSLELTNEDVMELLQYVGEIVEAKRSKIKTSFSQEDVGAITALVNSKLSQQ